MVTSVKTVDVTAPTSHEEEEAHRLDVTYLRDHGVHRMFEAMIKYLLKERPEQVVPGLLKMLGKDGPPPLQASIPGSISPLNNGHLLTPASAAGSPGSLQSPSSRMPSPLPGKRGGSSNGMRGGDGGSSNGRASVRPKASRIKWDERVEVLEITAVSERARRGDFWEDGEQEELRGGERSDECYFCCYEPNACEWSLFSLYEDPPGPDGSSAWFLVCASPRCLKQVKQDWTFSYCMGDSLDRCDVATLQNILSYLPVEGARGCALLSTRWQEAVWGSLVYDGEGMRAALLRDVVTQSFAHCCTAYVVQNMALSQADLAVVVAAVARNPVLADVTLVHCEVSVEGYVSLCAALAVSLASLSQVTIGPITFPTRDSPQQFVSLLFSLCGEALSDPVIMTLVGTDTDVTDLLTEDVLPPRTSLVLRF